jgi:hypothetical protein
MTASLVPGCTTVTINARYYTLHAHLAHVAADRKLDWPAKQRLIRRAEVVMAAATLQQASTDGTGTHPHGGDRIVGAVRDGLVRIDELSKPGRYTANQSGFWPVYVGSELTLGLIANTSFEPGARADRVALAAGFEHIVDCAEQATLTAGELGELVHLSVDAAVTGSDGELLARLFCAHHLDLERPSDRTRRDTISIMARALAMTESGSADAAFRAIVGYGAGPRVDPVLNQIDEVWPWRGTLLRHQSVNSWRRAWAWLVGLIGADLANVDGHTSPQQLADAAVAAVHATGTVQQWLANLPPVVDEHGDPIDAESEVGARSLSEFERALNIIALGGERVGTLDGTAQVAFEGPRRAVLDPVWVREHFHSALAQPMPDFVHDLTHEIINRAERVAHRKARIQRDGTYRIPSRVHRHAGNLWKTSDEGRGNVGLRVNELARNLAAVGVLARQGGSLRLTDYGAGLLP